jgi:hypothetical protein
MTDVPKKTFDDRTSGAALPGMVGLRNFDEGVVTTLGAEVSDEFQSYYIPSSKISPLLPPPGLPGIPVTFSHPEDIFERYRIPAIVVRRDDIAPASQRWHPSLQVARVPLEGANPIEARRGDPLDPTIYAGFDQYAAQKQPYPFDITYTLSLIARHRGHGPTETRANRAPTSGGSPINQVNALLDYVLRIYKPYSHVVVVDSMGDSRPYFSFLEAVSHIDEVPEVTERVLGFALTLRVEAELDLYDLETQRAVSGWLTMNESVV